MTAEGQSAEFAWGIDVSVSDVHVARVSGGAVPEFFQNPDGEPCTPAALLFAPDSGVSLGTQALNEAVIYPERLVQIGWAWEHERMGDVWTFDGRMLDGREIMALLLKYVCFDGSEEGIGPAVFAVPAHWKYSDCHALLEAFELAGGRTLSFIKSATAIALALDEERRLPAAVLDRPVVIVRIDDACEIVLLTGADEGRKLLSVERPSGVGFPHWVDAAASVVAEEFRQAHGVDLCDDPMAVTELLVRAKNAVRVLRHRRETTVSVAVSGIRSDVVLTREIFDLAIHGIMSRVTDGLRACAAKIAESGLEVGGVLLVGWTAATPQVMDAVGQVFDVPVNYVDAGTAARGAALIAAAKMAECESTPDATTAS